MNDFPKLDERDPFVQMVFRAVAITVGVAFAAALALEWMRPELRAPLFVPIAAALFVGALGFQVELVRKQYVIAVLWLAAAVLLLPAVGWLLLIVARVPFEATEAKFISLIPQAVVAPALFMAAKKRFEGYQRG